MGATAFIMANFLNVSYVEVALAAVIPSALYYFGLFMQIDLLRGSKSTRRCTQRRASYDLSDY